MDEAALLAAGRYDELVRLLTPASDGGSSSDSNNLAIVYRRMHNLPSEVFYALRAYQQDPCRSGVINTVCNALESAQDYSALAALYQSAPSYRAWDRHHHLSAAKALLESNRLDAAQAALARAGDFPRHARADQVLALAFANASLDHAAAHAALDRLQELGEPRVVDRMWVHFAAGEMRPALELHGRLPAAARNKSRAMKIALLSALALEDRAAVAALLKDSPRASGVLPAAEGLLAGRRTVEVATSTRRYTFPFMASNLSVGLPHAAGMFYEREALDMLRAFVPRGGVVVDVGANIGNHSAFFAGETGAQVVAFECNPRMAARLRETVELCGLGERICLDHLGMAVSDAAGEARFNFVRNDFSNILGSERDQVVPAMTLDSLSVPRCDLLKIDVDGGELQVLAGAGRFVELHRPAVSIEALLRNITPVINWFSARRYDVYNEDTRADPYSDFIFLPSEASKQP
jgi:FkbM family methyltransferase